MGIGVEADKLTEWSAKLNCGISQILFLYLGLPIGESEKSASCWAPVIQKLKLKLSYLENRFLSFAGRIVLLRSVFTALPIYYLSFFEAPGKVVKEITNLLRNFMWDARLESGNRKIAWISWKRIYSDKESGWLGIKDIHNFNTSLLGSWF